MESMEWGLIEKVGKKCINVLHYNYQVNTLPVKIYGFHMEYVGT
jgi:hypothetical protein